MYEYTICNVFDKDIFVKQCLAIERHIPDLSKSDLLEDVDGSQVQTYILKSNKTIKVMNDKLIGVEIHSEEELTKYFK